MTTAELQKQIVELEKEIMEKKKELTALRKAVPDKKIPNYEFVRSNGKEVSLLELFGEKDELIVIHNMGKGCFYCTMWADGFNGVYHHLRDKASFVVSSPDAPSVQDDLAASRKWQFPMISVKESSFTSDVGYKKGDHYYPGVSTFRKDKDGNIYLHAQADLGPGDDYCVTWHLFDLLPSGAQDVKVNIKLNDSSAYQLTNNIAVAVRDYEKAIPFYKDILGMNVVETFDNETQMEICGTNFFIEDHLENQVFLEFAVDKIEEAKAQLLEHGCEVTKEYSQTSIMVSDPYGLKFHVYEIQK